MAATLPCVNERDLRHGGMREVWVHEMIPGSEGHPAQQYDCSCYAASAFVGGSKGFLGRQKSCFLVLVPFIADWLRGLCLPVDELAERILVENMRGE